MINMSDLERMDVSKLFQKIFFCLLTSSGMFIPGFLFIFLYSRNMFFDLSTIKLILLSVAVSFPLVLINCFIFNTKIKIAEETDKSNRLFVDLTLASLTSNFSIITLLLLYYLTDLPVKNLNHGIWFLLIFNFGFLVFEIVWESLENSKKNKISPK